MVSLLFPSVGWGGWQHVTDVYYVDFDRIRVHNRYVYFYQMTPESGSLSSIDFNYLSKTAYIKLDCINLRYKIMEYGFYSGQMTIGETFVYNMPDKPWTPATPNSHGELVFVTVCNFLINK
jgi:hypothetical protein